MDEHVFLLCTVGSSPEPVAASIAHWKPVRCMFLPSPQTRDAVQGKVLPALQDAGCPLPPGSWDCRVFADPENMTSCVRQSRELRDLVQQWTERGEDHVVVVDFTAGTKCMSASLALEASRWKCRFSYVGGSARDKNGVGIVIKGQEKVLHSPNPWEALGYQAREEALLHFNNGAHAQAAMSLSEVRKRLRDDTARSEVSALIQLCEAYDHWDRFDHKQARNRLQDVLKNINNLRNMLGQDVHGLQARLQAHLPFLEALTDSQGPLREHVLDLLANALRRKAAGRLDDAVARLYRSVETMAQVRLREGHGISDTAAVPLDAVPAPLAASWQNRQEQGLLRLGLQDAYALLQALDDPLGRRFVELDFADKKRSPLVARNSSILAHGFKPVTEGAWKTLWDGCLQLAEVQEEELVQFARL